MDVDDGGLGADAGYGNRVTQPRVLKPRHGAAVFGQPPSAPFTGLKRKPPNTRDVPHHWFWDSADLHGRFGPRGRAKNGDR